MTQRRCYWLLKAPEHPEEDVPCVLVHYLDTVYSATMPTPDSVDFTCGNFDLSLSRSSVPCAHQPVAGGSDLLNTSQAVACMQHTRSCPLFKLPHASMSATAISQQWRADSASQERIPGSQDGGGNRHSTLGGVESGTPDAGGGMVAVAGGSGSSWWVSRELELESLLAAGNPQVPLPVGNVPGTTLPPKPEALNPRP